MKGETKFTPGPWHVVSDREDELKVKGPSDEWVADCADGFWSDEADGWVMAEESPANARLIAAAPALYEALAGWVAWLDSDDEGWGDRAAEYEQRLLSNARAALAAARGETK